MVRKKTLGFLYVRFHKHWSAISMFVLCSRAMAYDLIIGVLNQADPNWLSYTYIYVYIWAARTGGNADWLDKAWYKTQCSLQSKGHTISHAYFCLMFIVIIIKYIYIYMQNFVGQRCICVYFAFHECLSKIWLLFSFASLQASGRIVRKSCTEDLGKLLLEEVLRSYFLADPKRIPAIQNSEDCF